jgi:hypothetical protein
VPRHAAQLVVTVQEARPAPGRIGAVDLRPSRLPAGRIALLALGGIALLLGTYTGLARGGIQHRFVGADLHGVVMVLGFLGTLIALERAVALGRPWGYLGPSLSGAAVLTLPVARPLGGILLVAAGLVVVLTYVALMRRGHLDVHLGIMMVGAVAWVAAAALWMQGAGPVRITPLLAAFLVLTIIGERLELSRLTMPTGASRARFLVLVGLFVVGVGVSPWWRAAGLLLGGLALLGQVAWLVRYDVARRTARRPGLPRFAAVCMLGAYGWLAVSGALWLAMGAGARGALLHDALVHSLFLGFVLSMVMGHAPIILPAVLRMPLAFLRVAYVPLLLLHLSVAVRIAADLAGSLWWREMAMHGNVAALLLFLAVSVIAARRGRRTRTWDPQVSMEVVR